nr:PREDICTED: uncharacterized protein LOC105662055 [Megachile rotundata]
MEEINSYYKWNTIFLWSVGLWPYCNKKFRLLHNGIISLITWASVISQLVAIFGVEKDLFRQLRDISITAMAIAALTKYHVTWYEINYVKAQVNQIRLDWETNNVEVLRIMQIYAFYGKRLVILFATFFYPGLSIVILYHISPIILNVIVPLNESRPIKFPIDLEFWIEEEQYPILNISLFCLVVIVDVAVLVGTESFSIMICLHVAGLFDVASYYYEKAVLSESVPSYRPQNSKNKEIVSYIATGVFFHRKALQSAFHVFTTVFRVINTLVSEGLFMTQTKGAKCRTLSWFYWVLLARASICFARNRIFKLFYLFKLSVTVFQLSDIGEAIFSVLVLLATFGYMFWMNLAVEYIIDNASSIPIKT